jgi:cell division septal protein FtsQ
MPQTNPRWLIQKAPGDLKAQVRIAVELGYHVVSQTASSAQLMRKKQFSCLIATLSLFVFGIGFLIYLFYFLSKKDDLIYLDADAQPSKEELRRELEERAKRAMVRNGLILKAVAALFGASILLAIIGSLVGSR